MARGLIMAAALAALACGKGDSESGSGAVLAAWAKAGMKPGSFEPTKEGIGGGRCRGGNINGLDATLCEFDDVAAAKRAEAAGLAEIRGVTGLALAEGKLLLVLADPKQTDPSGRSMNELAKAFRNR